MKHWHYLSSIIKTSYLAKLLSSPVFTRKKKKAKQKQIKHDYRTCASQMEVNLALCFLISLVMQICAF